MATWKYEFINPITRSLHFAEGGFVSYARALAWAQHALAVDHRWADDEVVQDGMYSALHQRPEIEFDLRLVPSDTGQQPIALRVTQEL